MPAHRALQQGWRGGGASRDASARDNGADRASRAERNRHAAADGHVDADCYIQPDAHADGHVDADCDADADDDPDQHGDSDFQPYAARHGKRDRRPEQRLEARTNFIVGDGCVRIHVSLRTVRCAE